jgi:hypothetical protein
MQTTGQKFTKYTLAGTAGLATVLITFKTIQKSLKAQKAVGLKLSTNKYVRWASQFYSALHGSWYDEDEQTVYRVATEICGATQWEDTAKAYKKEYGIDLLKDIQKYLNSSEYNIFLQKLSIC